MAAANVNAERGVRFAHVCLAVNDIEVAMNDYRDILSVVSPQHLVMPTVYYDDFGMSEERLSFATFPDPAGGCEIQFLQPRTPGTPLFERVREHGEHVHHLCFTAPQVRDMVGQLEHLGIGIVPQGYSTDPQMPWQEWTFADPKRTHGVLVELANHYDSVDTKWVPGPGVAPALDQPHHA